MERTTHRRRTIVAAAMIGSGLVAFLIGVTSAASSAGQGNPGAPPGNNGTVKVDNVDFSSPQNRNVPHVGCQFAIEWYNYEAGDLSSSVTFWAWPPTTDNGPKVLKTDTIGIGEDGAGGGTDLDARRVYDLTSQLLAITPHQNQGWHVKLEIHADGSQGADKKHKVFWVTGCVQSTTTTSAPPTTTTTAPPTTTTQPEVGGTTTTTAPAGTTTTVAVGGVVETTTTAPEVLGVVVTPEAPAAPEEAVPTELARTGAGDFTLMLAIAGLALMVLGGAVIGAGRLATVRR